MASSAAAGSVIAASTTSSSSSSSSKQTPAGLASAAAASSSSSLVSANAGRSWQQLVLEPISANFRRDLGRLLPPSSFTPWGHAKYLEDFELCSENVSATASSTSALVASLPLTRVICSPQQLSFIEQLELKYTAYVITRASFPSSPLSELADQVHQGWEQLRDLLKLSPAKIQLENVSAAASSSSSSSSEQAPASLRGASAVTSSSLEDLADKALQAYSELKPATMIYKLPVIFGVDVWNQCLSLEFLQLHRSASAAASSSSSSSSEQAPGSLASASAAAPSSSSSSLEQPPASLVSASATDDDDIYG